MDINSLLSPQDAPASNPSTSSTTSSARASPSTTQSQPLTTRTTPARSSRKRAPSLVQQATTSPRHYADAQQLQQQQQRPPQLQPAHHLQPKHASILPQPHFQPVTYAPIAPQERRPQLPPLARNAHSSNIPTESRYAQSTQSSSFPLVQRHSSLSMDTLADLATMQHYQHSVRQSSAVSRNPDLASPQRSPSRSRAPKISPPLDHHHVPSTASPLRRGSIVNDISEAPAPIVSPRTFASPSMSPEDLQTVSDLTKQLADNTYLYTSHIQLVTLLHRGFRAHVSPPESPETYNDPHNFPLLAELRQARQAMDTRFACGEALRLDWIKDEIILSNSTEDRIAVIELCRKAVEDEAGSPALWRLYGDWLWYLHTTSKDINNIAYEESSIDADPLLSRMLASHPWSEEDKIVGGDVFTWDQTLSVWQEAVAATQWHIAESHNVWDPYMQLLLAHLETSSSTEKIEHVRQLFSDRLRQPHLTWQDTFQLFSQFITKYDGASYERAMSFENEKAARAKHEMSEREQTELELQRAIADEDRDREWTIMSEYLDWEFAQHRRKGSADFSRGLLIALCERCSLRFPTDAGFWEDHLDLQGERANANDAVIAVAIRATRHAPWIGNLWSKYLYALEAANYPFEEVENVKHRATSTGLLEEVDMSELIKVYSAWCGYLRRRAFSPKSGEDERDIAEVAICSAIENVKDIGQKRFGKDFKGDPAFRIERIYFKFLGQTGNFDKARREWQKLAKTHGDQYDFWERWYLWEMVVWSLGGARDRPEPATAVLVKAIRHPTLDWPERMIDQYLHHVCQNESVEQVQKAHIEIRKKSREIARRRAKEAADAAAAQQVAAEPYAKSEPVTGDVDMTTEDGEQNHSGKRKRSVDENMQEPAKRTKAEHDAADASTTDSSSKQAQLKRDRENTSIIVRNLPANIDERRVRGFFKDCGKILSLNITAQDDDNATATVEFETQDDVLAAQTRNLKTIDGHEIEVQAGTGTTLWVRNYPPEADEKYIRDLFSAYGEIVSVRFPSLKVNSQRRFCYVQFSTAAQAQAATQLDGKALGGPLVLGAKISNPIAKRSRSGATEEGRECYVGNVDWQASEEEVRALFSEHGTVEVVRILRNMSGKSKGAAFVVFSSKEEAERAASAMDKKEFRSRILKVEVSKPIHTKKKSTIVIRGDDASASPDPAGAMDADASASAERKPAAPNYRERSLALLNLPDTVNDARIRALCETHGPLKKIIMRLENGGALVEFENIADVGRAGMALDGYEITPGQKLRVGEAREVFHSAAGASASASVSRSGSGSGSGTSAAPRSKSAFITPHIARPVAGGARGGRGGRRGGLGFKRAENARRVNGSGAAGQDGDTPTGGKSQDDFRALLKG